MKPLHRGSNKYSWWRITTVHSKIKSEKLLYTVLTAVYPTVVLSSMTLTVSGADSELS